MAAVLLAAALFGTTGTAQALGPETTTPLGVGAVRLVVGGAALLLVLPLVGGSLRAAVALAASRTGLLLGLCTATYQVAFFAAVERAGVAVGALVAIGAGPAVAAVLALAVLGERPAGSWLAATGVCVGGLALLSAGDAGRADPLGLLLALLAGSAYAGYTVAARQLLLAGRGSGDVMAAAFGLGGLLLVPLLLTQPLGWLATGAGLGLAVYLGLATTTLAYVLFGRGLAVLPAGPVTTLVLAEPLVATALGLGLLDERLDALGAAGAVLLLVGLVAQGAVSVRGGRRLGDALPVVDDGALDPR